MKHEMGRSIKVHDLGDFEGDNEMHESASKTRKYTHRDDFDGNGGRRDISIIAEDED